MQENDNELLDYCKKCKQGNEFNPVPCSSCLLVPDYIRKIKQDELEHDLMIDLK